MKKGHILLILAAVLALWACQKDPVVEPVDNTPKEMTVSMTSIAAEKAGGDFAVTVTAPTRPSVSSKPDWVSVQDGTYNSSTYKMTLTLKVSAFGDYGSREGDVVISAGSLSKTVSITQQGREKPNTQTDITKTLVTDGAVAGAQALYDYLLSLYGKKVLSGVMADVAWNNDVAAQVYGQCGKYPAVNGYDFIHIHRSGENWINYSDLSPVKTWTGAGGIVSLMWHFNVPKSASAPGHVEDVTCSTSETSFKASNVFTEGTWEQVWFDYYVDKVADVMLLLQDAGIVALWRPFHEAAGNYYALQYAGSAWFWWGAEGPEVFKKLWTRLWDAFVAKGVKNVIWVWTAQLFNGDASAYDSDEAYYPGDDRVDIVGRDLYGGTAADCAREFVQLQNAYPHKMISLSECGWNGDKTDIATISDQWAAGALWSWFMVWYHQDKTSMASSAWWKTALESEYVITREQVSI